MKHLFPLAIFIAVAASPLPAEETKLQWRFVNGAVSSRDVQLQLRSGETVRGWVNNLSLASVGLGRQDGNVERTIAADDVVRITVYRPRSPQRRALRRSVGEAFRTSARNVATPWGPFAVAGVGLTAGYYLAALPFCLVGDLATAGSGGQPERVILIVPEVP